MRRALTLVLVFAAGCATTPPPTAPTRAPLEPLAWPADSPELERAVLNRVSWGANRSSYAEIAQLGTGRWLDAQLRPAPARLDYVLSLFPGLREMLGKLHIDGKPVNFREKDHGFFSLDLGHKNLFQGPQLAVLNGNPISFTDMGLENVEIEDKSDANAYHIPQGCLVIYDPKNTQPKGARPDISTLDIAPALLKNFALPVPEYMQKPAALAASA